MTFDSAAISRVLDGLVHASAVDDRLQMLRHRYFLLVHLGFGLFALSAFPVWLALVGATSLAEALTFTWLLAPIAVAVYLSRTGRLAVAHLASAAVFTGLIAWVAGLTGGVHSLVIACLVLVPFEASLSGSRRVAAASVAIAGLGLCALLLFVPEGLATALESTHSPVVGSMIVLGAILYAGGLAIRVEGLARESARVARSGEERYRLLADNSTDMITRHAANGAVEFVSPAVRTLTGLGIGEVMGDGLFRRVHVADRPAFLNALSGAYTERRNVTVEFRLQREGDPAASSGTPVFIPVEMRCRPVVGPLGDVSAVVAVTRDISAVKERESELREARETAERANHAKTQFLAHMSHELRTPLNAIIGFSEILESDQVGQLLVERRREYARLIHSSGEHLLQVVNGILDMSKIESGMFEIQPETLPLGPIVIGCCDMMSGQAAERGLTLVRALADDLPEISVDRRACKQILLNLLSNAVKFTDRGGIVTIGARVEGRFMAIFVRDTGIGIAAEDLPRLGTPFVQAETVYTRHYEGTGLGLSMVKGLAELHGGRMVLESKPGKGTVATVWLPVERDEKRAEDVAAQTVDSRIEFLKERKSA